MIFTATNINGGFIIEPERLYDERGFFARTWCQQEFCSRGLNSQWVQCSVSFSQKKGTLRGMHYQAAPSEETKLVRCTRGEIYDVIIDMRPDSPTFKQHTAVVLSSENHKMVYIPEGCAHGFLTLDDNTEVFYQMSEFYHAELAKGVRWNDQAFNIDWPAEVKVISERDRNYIDFVG
jgi:dTDP-4-dehydrorhamnose 3,5-epimerase